ncbi:hypothetical protein [Kutzneria sp. CA-103260]|uniref:hypothetical protein n=1 Tax=Kutzneria sp. CA-103260 TaxID=2802641 RepID=UPI001BAABEC6|nr:hypothetical protein [Kutzneria sp. CA-103260]QUQ68637.1 Cell division coordinator CpoB [Kutzneria sp. CA-103260]
MDYPPFEQQYTAYPPPEPEPTPTPRSHDPVAVAVGNASLLSVGYFMLGRPRLAVVTLVITVGLLALLVTTVPTLAFEILILLWWLVLIGHGWFLAGGRTRGVVLWWPQRAVALVVTVLVLLAFGLLRFDDITIGQTVAQARQSGNCEQALTAMDGVWLGNRLADAPSTADGDLAVQACQRLDVARSKLTTGLTGDSNALKAGFDGLGAVLADLPGHEKMVDVALSGFLAGLPGKDPCHAAAVTDWLRQRKPTHNDLDRSAAVVPKVAPDALVGCGDNLMSSNDWETARKRYQQLLDQYPGNALTAKAQDGVTKATQAIELANVRRLLADTTDGQPAYCSQPAQYSAAPAYGHGVNPSLIYGTDEYAQELPGGWQVSDPAQAVVVICAGTKDYGDPVQTCPYTAESGVFSTIPTDVTFHKIAVPVKAYELRTGKLITDKAVQIGGASCPDTIHWSSALDDSPPPKDMYVTSSPPDVVAAFGTVINP